MNESLNTHRIFQIQTKDQFDSFIYLSTYIIIEESKALSEIIMGWHDEVIAHDPSIEVSTSTCKVL